MSDNSKDIVIIGIGHSSLYENAQSSKLTTLGLKELAQSVDAYNSKQDRLTEYRFCASLAKKIVEKLNAKGIIGMTANRYIGWDINGNSKIERDMRAEIKAINAEIKKQNGQVKAAIDLHLNGGMTSNKKGYYLAYHSSSDLGKKLCEAISGNIAKVMDYKLTKNSFKTPSASTGKTAGMGFPRSVQVPAALLELFFADSNVDVELALNNFDALAEAIASGFESFCKNEEVPFDPTNIVEDSKVKSSALVTEKLKPQFNDDQVKEVAIETQRKLTPIERKMGEGGDHYAFRLKNDIEIIGVKPPPFSSSRIDDSGNIISIPVIRPGGISYLQKTYPKFQNVDITSDMPIGKKHIFAHTEFVVRSYEIILNAYGNILIEAPGNVKMAAGQQVDIIAGYNLNLEADTIVTITANDIITSGNSTISGNLRVNGGAAFTGSVYANNGLYAPSFNGPAIIDKTNKQSLWGYQSGNYTVTTQLITLLPGEIELSEPVKQGDTKLKIASGQITGSTFIVLDGGIISTAEDPEAIVEIPPHLHYFKRLNGILADTSADIQQAAAIKIN